ncbi:MAG TPA: PASTA domain-containing protein [Firmicutes bacterium]|nr:PASTA domain-containing protein [Bacillota bacterium]
MRTIICKRCGSPIDASLGECPVCGAVYYILPEDDPSEEPDETRVWQQDEAEKIYKAIERSERSDGDEPTHLFDSEEMKKIEKEKAVPEPVPKPPAERPAPARDPRDRLPARTWVYAAAAAAMLAVLALVLCFMTGVFDFGSAGGEMPQLVGLERGVAEGQLGAIGITPDVIYEQSSEPAETVIRQEPAEGTEVGGSSAVTLWVSSGGGESGDEEPETGYVEVPPLTGMSFDAAADILAGLGLSAVRGSDVYSQSPEGEVVAQSPLSGARLQPGGTVTLTVSKGQEEGEFTVVLTAGTGGSVSPSGSVTVVAGGTIDIFVTPDEGYVLRELRIDGKSVGAVSEYTLNDIQESHSVYAVFDAVEQPEETDQPEVTLPPESLPPVSPSDIR